MDFIKKTLLVTLLTICISCNNKTEPNQVPIPQKGLVTSKAMVVSARKEASKIGTDILKKGGNAFDAMIATEMALAVTYPYAGNLGGGGFMIYRKSNGETGALDYREKAPMSSSRDMFLDKDGNPIPEKSQRGPLAVGVPGTVAGIFATYKKFGTLPIKEILTPVVNLAKKGYVITEKQQKRFEKYRNVFIETNGDTILYAHKHKVLDTVKNINLAHTLERIIENGQSEFYKGKTGRKLVDFIQAKGGIITLEDLSNYKAIWRTPITCLLYTSPSPRDA